MSSYGTEIARFNQSLIRFEMARSLFKFLTEFKGNPKKKMKKVDTKAIKYKKNKYTGRIIMSTQNAIEDVADLFESIGFKEVAEKIRKKVDFDPLTPAVSLDPLPLNHPKFSLETPLQMQPEDPPEPTMEELRKLSDDMDSQAEIYESKINVLLAMIKVDVSEGKFSTEIYEKALVSYHIFTKYFVPPD